MSKIPFRDRLKDMTDEEVYGVDTSTLDETNKHYLELEKQKRDFRRDRQADDRDAWRWFVERWMQALALGMSFIALIISIVALLK